MKLRFGQGRTNPWGKDPKTKEESIRYARYLFDNPPPKSFIKINTTNLDIERVCNLILSPDVAAEASQTVLGDKETATNPEQAKDRTKTKNLGVEASI
jgi:hypothetical protein